MGCRGVAGQVNTCSTSVWLCVLSEESIRKRVGKKEIKMHINKTFLQTGYCYVRCVMVQACFQPFSTICVLWDGACDIWSIARLRHKLFVIRAPLLFLKFLHLICKDTYLQSNVSHVRILVFVFLSVILNASHIFEFWELFRNCLDRTRWGSWDVCGGTHSQTGSLSIMHASSSSTDKTLCL